MSSQGASSTSSSSENMDPNNNNCQQSQQSKKPKEQQKKNSNGSAPVTSGGGGVTPFKSFDMKSLSSEVKRLAASGKLFNVMREVDRRGGFQGFQGYCATRGMRRGGQRRREMNKNGQKNNQVEPDEPSTSGINNY